MFFSIIVPVYRTSKYLDECLQSILSQLMNDYELLLMIDGSDDCCSALCDEYAVKYPFVRVVHKINEGLMMTRRRGFSLFSGEYVINIDSDDYLINADAFLKIKETIEKHNCDLVIYDYVYGTDGIKPDRVIRCFDDVDTDCESFFDDPSKVAKGFLCERPINAMWIKSASRNIIDSYVDYLEWKKTICRGEDKFQSFPILSNAKRIGYVSAPLYYYRWTEGSISNKPKLRFYDAYCTIYQREDEYLQKWNLGDEINNQAFKRRIPQLMDVIIGGYQRANTKQLRKEWRTFVVRVGEDSYFQDLVRKSKELGILRYYQMVCGLITGGHPHLTAMLIETVSFISKVKHGGKV